MKFKINLQKSKAAEIEKIIGKFLLIIIILVFGISGVVGACNNTANYTIHEWGVWQQEYSSSFTHIYGMPPKSEFKIGAKIGKPVIYFHSNESFKIDIGILFNYPDVTNIIALPDASVSYNEINWNNLYIEDNSIIEYNNTDIDPNDSYVRLHPTGRYLSFPIDNDTITRIDNTTFKYKYLFYEGDVEKPLGVEARIFDNKTTATFYIKNLANHTIYDVFLVYIRNIDVLNCTDWRCGREYYSASYIYIPQLNAHENAAVIGDITDNKSLIESSITQKVRDKLINRGLTLSEANELVDYWSPIWFGDDTSFVLYTMPQEIYDNELPIVMCPEPEDTTRIGMFYVEDIPLENPLTCNEKYEILRAAWQKKGQSQENLIELILYGIVSIAVTLFYVISLAAIILAVIYKILMKRQIGELLLILFCLLTIVLMLAQAITEFDIISSSPLYGETPGGCYYSYKCKHFWGEIQEEVYGFDLLLCKFDRLSVYWFNKRHSQMFFWPFIHIFFVLMLLEYIFSRVWKYFTLLFIPIIILAFIFFTGIFRFYPLYAFSFLTIMVSTYLGFRKNKKYLIGTILVLFGGFLAAVLSGWGHRIFGELLFILCLFYLIGIALRNLLPPKEIIGKNFIFIWLGLIIISGWLDYSLIWRMLLVIGLFYVCWILLKGFRNNKIKLEKSSSNLLESIKKLNEKIIK
ncbi:hypothetical protein BEH94_03985 [Candidatus Altiarchaeales archaeon WOR_SM1_SCG]|nr:hypothetical protein BEH94_03985 [Candidatus Altiarchaeales archaeon WOR_SM1_SCG]